MSESLEFVVPRVGESDLRFRLSEGEILYLLGPNGSGKSSIVSHLFRQHMGNAKRISAHRQTWFNSNTLDMTPLHRENVENNIRSNDAQAESRFRLHNPAERASVAIYDLIDADTMLARQIADLVRSKEVDLAMKHAETPSPIKTINDLMKLSNIPVTIYVEKQQKIVARKNGGEPYSVAELSDGERNAFLIAADVLTAKPGSLIIIDEPERHLHRSIVTPLLKLLFINRHDCKFIISTHELTLPTDTGFAQIMLVRGCEYSNGSVTGWYADILPSEAEITDEDKIDILGSRRKIIFVEGGSASLDRPIYSLLFPGVSIVPKSSCREVERAVIGLRDAGGMHWLRAWGIIDNDQKDVAEISRLREIGIWALHHYSVESLYYNGDVIRRIAERQAKIIGGDSELLFNNAIAAAVRYAKENKKHLVKNAVQRAVRERIMGHFPSKNETISSDNIVINVPVADIKSRECQFFDQMVENNDWNGLVARYPMRESGAFEQIAKNLQIINRSVYTTMVLSMLSEDDDIVVILRQLLGDLYSEVSQ